MNFTFKAMAIVAITCAPWIVSAEQDSASAASVVAAAQVTLDGGELTIGAAGEVYELNGPGGFFYSSDKPYFDFEGDIPDGVYTFHVYKSVGVQGKIISEGSNVSNGRQSGTVPGQIMETVISGSFEISNNTISIVNP